MTNYFFNTKDGVKQFSSKEEAEKWAKWWGVPVTAIYAGDGFSLKRGFM